MTAGLNVLRDMARSNRGGDADAPPSDATTDALNRELSASRAWLERELDASALAAGGFAPPRPPAPEPAPAASQPLIRLREGRKMTLGDQTRALAGQTWRQVRRNFREMRKHPGGMINGWLADPGPSVDDQIAYKREKRWVPLGHDDGVADKAGTAYQSAIGIPGVAFFGACKGIVARPFRFGSAFFACYLIAAFTLIIVQPRIAGVAMLIALPIAVMAALIGLEAWAAASRRATQPPQPAPGEDDDDYEPPSD
jgi:hypothetical protein